MSGLEVEQDYEYDEGEIGGPMDVYWVEGHGLDPDDVLSAVVEHCLEVGRVPRIDYEDRPVEMWQQNVEHGDSVEYRRFTELPEDHRVRSLREITVLDLERRSHGATKCSIRGCGKPWSRGMADQVVWEPDGGEYLALEMWLCREHAAMVPEQSYRLRWIPVGATILLDAGDGA